MSAFPPTSNADPAQALRNYLDVVEDWHADLVEEAVTLFIKGEIPGFDGRFAPTAPMLAGACRKAAENRQRAAYIASLSAPRLMAPEIEKTPEQRERARELVASFVANLEAENIDAAETQRRNEQWVKVNARFQPDMSDEAVKSRLMSNKGTNWSVGDEDAA